MKPLITLDHLVKERYPRFIDALRDLDDALCMVHLFAALPSTGRITADRTANCAKLVKQWQHYIAKSRTLHKVFVSVKGVYFQAEIMGEPVTWIVPHQFTQAVPKEVDVRVMLTFLEFYEVFLQFVMFKLYSAQNMQYPPKVDKQLEAEGCFLLALKSDKIENADGTAAAADAAAAPAVAEAPKAAGKNAPKAKTSAAQLSTLPKLLKELDQGEEEDDEEEEEEGLGLLAAPLNEALGRTGLTAAAAVSATSARERRAENDDEEDEMEQRVFATQSTEPLKRLFANFVFFINREIPLEWMQLCTISFGAKVAWDGPTSPFPVGDARITHQIVDRPQQGIQNSSREYVQPQWVFDCINAQMVLPVQNYRPGCKLPPHLSPFVDDGKVGYMPKYREEIQRLQKQQGGQLTSSAAAADKEEAGDSAEEDNEEEEEDEEKQESKAVVVKGATGKRKEVPAPAPAPVPASAKKQKGGKAAPAPVASEDEEEEEEEEDEEEAQAQKKKDLLKSYTAGANAKKGPKGVVFQPEEVEVTEVK
jgi:pescadillo